MRNVSAYLERYCEYGGRINPSKKKLTVQLLHLIIIEPTARPGH